MNPLDRLFEALIIDPTDRYALAQLHALTHSQESGIRESALETLAQFGYLVVRLQPSQEIEVMG